jgi:hypothetical protein
MLVARAEPPSSIIVGNIEFILFAVVVLMKFEEECDWRCAAPEYLEWIVVVIFLLLGILFGSLYGNGNRKSSSFGQSII